MLDPDRMEFPIPIDRRVLGRDLINQPLLKQVLMQRSAENRIGWSDVVRRRWRVDDLARHWHPLRTSRKRSRFLSEPSAASCTRDPARVGQTLAGVPFNLLRYKPLHLP